MRGNSVSDLRQNRRASFRRLRQFMRKSEDQNQPAVRYSESREGAERMRIRSYVSALVRFGLLALVLPLNNAVGSTAPAKKPISEDEFLREFKANREISNRTVPAREQSGSKSLD